MNIEHFQIGSLSVEVTKKDIKNIHLSVYPPNGSIRISAPIRMKLETIRIYTISKLPWIKKQKDKFSKQERESKREYLERESHYLFGKRYLLKRLETSGKPSILLKQNHIEAKFPKDMTKKEMKATFETWYRDQLYTTSERILTRWAKVLEIDSAEFSIRKMKTRWGSYIPTKKKVWLNLELAKKPSECIEYIIVHELLHSKERNHNARFKALMSHHLPNWKELREKLNQLPISHMEWEY